MLVSDSAGHIGLGDVKFFSKIFLVGMGNDRRKAFFREGASWQKFIIGSHKG